MRRSISQIPPEEEVSLVWDFFSRAGQGIFVEVGANHPTLRSQTWHLEQQGWSGVLVEPNPDLCELLRQARPHSRVFQVAVGNDGQTGEVDLLLGVTDGHSTLKSIIGNPLSGKKVRVRLRTLDSILAEANIGRIDFLSVDVEGMELAVLQGFDLQKHRPRLILIEDHRHNYQKHFYLRRHGYRLVKRTRLNNWYVPDDSPATVASLNTRHEAWQMWRKMWLNMPFDNLRRKFKRTK
jgi:FkbM family methyltransferase